MLSHEFPEPDGHATDIAWKKEPLGQPDPDAAFWSANTKAAEEVTKQNEAAEAQMVDLTRFSELVNNERMLKVHMRKHQSVHWSQTRHRWKHVGRV